MPGHCLLAVHSFQYYMLSGYTSSNILIPSSPIAPDTLVHVRTQLLSSISKTCVCMVPGLQLASSHKQQMLPQLGCIFIALSFFGFSQDQKNFYATRCMYVLVTGQYYWPPLVFTSSKTKTCFCPIYHMLSVYKMYLLRSYGLRSTMSIKCSQ